MKKIVKTKLIHYLQNFGEKKAKSRLKILIRLNEYFTEDAWIKVIKSELDEYFTDFEICFVKSKLDFLIHSKNANIIFSFTYNEDFLIGNTNLKMFYLGQRGSESLQNSKLSEVSYYSIPPIGREYIAEYVLFAIIALKRKLYIPIRNQIKKRWEQKSILSNPFPSMNNIVYGIAGLGNIGSHIANKLSSLDYIVFGWDAINKNSASVNSFFERDNLDAFLQSIDFLIIALPLNSETKGLFNYEKLSLMKKGSFLINIGRGDLISEKALLRLLNEKIILGAALDVFSKEPLPKSSELWKFENIMITPHIAGNINLFINEIQLDFCHKIKITLSEYV